MDTYSLSKYSSVVQEVGGWDWLQRLLEVLDAVARRHGRQHRQRGAALGARPAAGALVLVLGVGYGNRIVQGSVASNAKVAQRRSRSTGRCLGSEDWLCKGCAASIANMVGPERAWHARRRWPPS